MVEGGCENLCLAPADTLNSIFETVMSTGRGIDDLQVVDVEFKRGGWRVD